MEPTVAEVVTESAPVVVALLKVAFVAEIPWKVEEAFTMIPRVVVGVSAPFTIDQSRLLSRALVSELEDTLLLNVVQFSDERHPKTVALAVSQVTLPPANVRPVEKVVVAVQVGTPDSQPSICPLLPPVSEIDAPEPITD